MAFLESGLLHFLLQPPKHLPLFDLAHAVHRQQFLHLLLALQLVLVDVDDFELGELRGVVQLDLILSCDLPPLSLADGIQVDGVALVEFAFFSADEFGVQLLEVVHDLVFVDAVPVLDHFFQISLELVLDLDVRFVDWSVFLEEVEFVNFEHHVVGVAHVVFLWLIDFWEEVSFNVDCPKAFALRWRLGEMLLRLAQFVVSPVFWPGYQFVEVFFLAVNLVVHQNFVLILFKNLRDLGQFVDALGQIAAHAH